MIEEIRENSILGGGNKRNLIGLSTDTKPIIYDGGELEAGSTFTEVNTGYEFVYNGGSWWKKKSSSGGSGGVTDLSSFTTDELTQGTTNLYLTNDEKTNYNNVVTEITNARNNKTDLNTRLNGIESNVGDNASNITSNTNKIGDMIGNGITEANLATAIKNDRTQLSQKANQSDLDATNATVTNKVDKVAGKGLSTNDYDNTEKAQVVTNKSDIATVKSQVSSLASGAPKAVSLVANMTDTTKNYVYTGSESGYTSGNWYYYDSTTTSWKSGGIYQSTGISDDSIGNSKFSTDLKKVNNLLDFNNLNILTAYPNALVISSSGSGKILYIPVSPDTEYTIKRSIISSKFTVFLTDTVPTIGVTATDWFNSNNSATVTEIIVKTKSTTQYLGVWFYLGSIDTAQPYTYYASGIQITKGTGYKNSYDTKILNVLESNFDDDLKNKIQNATHVWKFQKLEEKAGYYDGTGTLNTNISYHSYYINVTEGDNLRFNATLINGSSVCMIVYKLDDGSYSYQDKGSSSGIQVYTNKYIKIDKGITAIILNFSVGYTATVEKFEIGGNTKQFKPIDVTITKDAYISPYSTVVSAVGWNYGTISVTEGEVYRISTGLLGNGLKAIILSNGGTGSVNTIATYVQGTSKINNLIDYEIVIPSGATTMLINTLNSSEIIVKKTADVLIDNEIENINYQLLPKRKKTAVWFGTSIPCGLASGGGSYVQMVADMLNMHIVNEAVGSSCVRAGSFNNITADDPMGYGGMYFENLMRSLSLSSTEKQAIYDNWSKWQPIIPQAPVNFANAQDTIANYKNMSYDVKLDTYLTTDTFPDVFIFDHGHNDHTMLMNGTSVWGDEMLTIPTNEIDRTYAVGAMNFIIHRILDFNPKAKIIFIGHYENTRKENISKLQEIYQDSWCFPLERAWENVGLSQKTITSKGAWVNNLWVENYLSNATTYTMTQRFMQDDLHPHSDYSGETNRMLAEYHAEFLKHCIF